MLACFNAKGLRDQSKTTRLLRGLLSFSMDVAAMEETHLFARVVPSDFFVYSAYGNRQAGGVSLLVKCTLGARMDLFHVNALCEGAVGRGRSCCE